MRAIILAGGCGSRLWPLSKTTLPKQFLKFGEETSLLQKTLRRLLPLFRVEDVLIVTQQRYYQLLKAQAVEIDPAFTKQILVEPDRKNTGPAIAYALKYLQSLGASSDECVFVTSADQIISPEKTLLDALPLAESVARAGDIALFGIRPHKPETGFGYIKAKATKHPSVLKVEQFVEKPDLRTAEKYILSGDYFWNGGMFIFQIETFWQEAALHCPALKRESNFEDYPEISVDYALMEKTEHAYVIPLDVAWSDVGSWDSLYELLAKDENGNAKIGQILDLDTRNCLIVGDKRLISTIGLDDLLIVETEEALFIAKKGDSQRLKELIEILKERGKLQ